ncbi:MAG: response regulator [Bryobacteraceae bacterium]
MIERDRIQSPFPIRQYEVLLIEDNPADMRLVEYALLQCELPFRLHWVEDGIDALLFLHRKDRFARSPSPDLIFLDWNLPGKHGSEVLDVIKESPVLRRIPVVVVSGIDAPAEIARAYKSYANCFIVKGLDLTGPVRTAASFWLRVASLPAPPHSSNHRPF